MKFFRKTAMYNVFLTNLAILIVFILFLLAGYFFRVGQDIYENSQIWCDVKYVDEKKSE